MHNDSDKRGQVVAILSGKGGSGKTTAALAMGKLLGDVGLRVLLIDFDLATSGASYFFSPRLSGELPIGIIDHIDTINSFDHSEPDSAIVLEAHVLEVAKGFDFIASRTRLGTQRSDDLQDAKWHECSEMVLRKMVSQARAKYDVVLIDAQAGYSRTSAASSKVADRAIIVSESDRISSEAVDNLIAQLGDSLPTFRRYLINKVEIKEAGMYKATAEVFRSMNRLPPLPFDFSVRRAFGDRQIPIDLDKPTPLLIALFATLKEAFPELDELLGRYEEEKITNLFDRYENELELIIAERDKARRQLRSIDNSGVSRQLIRQRRNMVMSIIAIPLALFLYSRWLDLSPALRSSPTTIGVGIVVLISGIAPFMFFTYADLLAKQREDEQNREREGGLRARVADSEREIERYRNLIAVRAKEYLIDFKPAADEK